MWKSISVKGRMEAAQKAARTPHAPRGGLPPLSSLTRSVRSTLCESPGILLSFGDDEIATIRPKNRKVLVPTLRLRVSWNCCGRNRRQEASPDADGAGAKPQSATGVASYSLDSRTLSRFASERTPWMTPTCLTPRLRVGTHSLDALDDPKFGVPTQRAGTGVSQLRSAADNAAAVVRGVSVAASENSAAGADSATPPLSSALLISLAA